MRLAAVPRIAQRRVVAAHQPSIRQPPRAESTVILGRVREVYNACAAQELQKDQAPPTEPRSLPAGRSLPRDTAPRRDHDANSGGTTRSSWGMYTPPIAPAHGRVAGLSDAPVPASTRPSPTVAELGSGSPVSPGLLPGSRWRTPRCRERPAPTSAGWSSESHGRVRWLLAHPRLFVRNVLSVTIRAA